MSKWERVAIGSVTLDKISTIAQKNNLEQIDYIDVSSIDNLQKKITNYCTMQLKDAPSRAKQILQLSDILVSTIRPNLNSVALVSVQTDNAMIGSTAFTVLRTLNNIDVLYLFYFCTSNFFVSELCKEARGASYPAVSNKIVKSVQIPLPPLPIQKQIAKVLDTATGLVEHHQTMLEELDNLAQSVFYQMFGDPVTNEKGWEVESVGEKLKIVDGDRGKSYPKAQDFSETGYCMFLNTSNVTLDGLNFDNVNYVSRDKSEQLGKGKLKQKSFILTTRGTVGNIVYYNPNTFPCKHVRINSGMVIIEFEDTEIIPNFFLYCFTSHSFKQNLTRYMSGSAQPQLPIQNMKKILFPLPPLPLQQEFSTIIEKIEEQKEQVRQGLKESQALLDSLMNQYFGN